MTNEKLEDLLQDVGDSIVDVFDQMSKGNWEDDHGHKVLHNKAMHELRGSLIKIMSYRAEELEYSEPEGVFYKVNIDE